VTAAAELWTYRNLIYNLAQRELRSRYKKSILGWAWSLINPASTLVIFSFVFGVIFGATPPSPAGNGHTDSFALYLFCGLVVWNFFSGTLTGAIGSLQASGPLLNKVYFPPACPPIANMFTVLLQALIEGGILVVIMIVLGNVGPTFLLFPVLLVFVGLFGLGIGMVAAVYNVYLRDVSYLVGIGMNVLFYATPIVYPISQVQEKVPSWAFNLYEMNPLVHFVAWSRDAFYLLEWPSWTSLLGTATVSVVVFLLGSIIFSRKARNVIEEL
jgi:ABC-type polysaccharide/polyol phosphate export permease